MAMGRPKGAPLTLEKYYAFFVDPWSISFTIEQLNDIISMHGFVRLHNYTKKDIMRHLVGQVDLQPPRRSTLHNAAPAARHSAAESIPAAQAAADVDAIGWMECPIGAVAAFAGFGEAPPERLEPMPPPADHVLALALAVRRARSKRTRGSAYPRRSAPEKEEDMELDEEEIWQAPLSPPPQCMRSPTPPPAPEKANVKEEDMELDEEEIWQPPAPPSPPPMWMRSPTPPPPPGSPPRAQSVVPPPPSSPCRVHLGPAIAPPPEISSPPPPGFSSPPPPGFGSPPPPGFGSPPPQGFSLPPPPGFGSPPPPCWSRPALAPLPTLPPGFGTPPPPCWSRPTLPPLLPTPPPGFGSPQVTPPPPHLSWGLPLPMVPPPSGPGAPPMFAHHSEPAGPPPHWRPMVPPSYPAPCWDAPFVLPPPPEQAPWRWPHPPPRWAPPHMMQQQRPPPPWGCMMPSAPPPVPPQYPPRFEEQPSGVSWGRHREVLYF